MIWFYADICPAVNKFIVPTIIRPLRRNLQVWTFISSLICSTKMYRRSSLHCDVQRVRFWPDAPRSVLWCGCSRRSWLQRAVSLCSVVCAASLCRTFLCNTQMTVITIHHSAVVNSSAINRPSIVDAFVPFQLAYHEKLRTPSIRPRYFYLTVRPSWWASLVFGVITLCVYVNYLTCVADTDGVVRHCVLHV